MSNFSTYLVEAPRHYARFLLGPDQGRFTKYDWFGAEAFRRNLARQGRVVTGIIDAGREIDSYFATYTVQGD